MIASYFDFFGQWCLIKVSAPMGAFHGAAQPVSLDDAVAFLRSSPGLSLGQSTGVLALASAS
jgi:hypothetical protein